MSKKLLKFEIGKIFAPEFEQLKGKDLQSNLEAMATKIEEGEYTKALTNDELGIAKSELADVSIKLAKIADAKKEAMEEFKFQEKEPKKQHKDLLEMIKTKSVRKEGKLYLVDDQEAGFMYKFDENAICVDARPLSPTERQYSIQENVRQLKAER